jgi:NIMA (never in mitosis gene a)-related kinase
MPLEDYQTLERIGKGKYCSVYRVRRLDDDRKFALKKVNLGLLEERARRNALAEVKLLKMLHNDGIVSLIEAFLEESSQTLWYLRCNAA